MHESGIVRDLVRRIEQAAQESGAQRISGVSVWLGALSQFSPGHFREHFAEEVRGTRAESAELRIEVSDDALHPHAQAVLLQSLDLEVSDEST
ncbi:MAG: hydrogenase/urease maturation nickel metallochaperone HypA [Acetobacteraceae bacterium]